MDQRKIYEQYSICCEYVSHPEQARHIATNAVPAALIRKGVAVLIVNGELFQEKTKMPSPVRLAENGLLNAA